MKPLDPDPLYCDWCAQKPCPHGVTKTAHYYPRPGCADCVDTARAAGCVACGSLYATDNDVPDPVIPDEHAADKTDTLGTEDIGASFTDFYIRPMYWLEQSVPNDADCAGEAS